ncbi:MAG TPA: VCBS repeat-containing protein, partial [Planctomycetota bacterium]|nr:VCBS repeat-containing protein [Planctomycetota bacterium]
LDHDGRVDLVLARTDRPGLWDIVKVLVTKEIPVEMLIFHADGTPGVYPRAPQDRREIDIPLLFSSARRGVQIGTSAVITVLGDLTGDGVNDLVLRAGEKKLAVYAGRRGKGFSEDPTFEVPVTSMDGYRFLEPDAQDLNGDGVADLALTYYSWDAKADRLSILLSPGGPRKTKPVEPTLPAGAKNGR